MRATILTCSTLLITPLILGLTACAGPGEGPPKNGEESPDMTIAADIETRLDRFAPVELEADLSVLSDADRRTLVKLVEASRLMDEIFLRQASRDNPALEARLPELGGPGADAARTFFALNFGPWDRLRGFEPFLGHTARPEGAGHYPTDMSAEELRTWIADHPEDADAATGLYTRVDRAADGGLLAVPYSQAYRQWLEPAAELLRQAAAETDNETLKRFLALRADAFLSDDYFESDMAWMDLDAPLEVTIGPYETYEDGLFGYKAAFESFVTVALPAESAKLAVYKGELPWLERNLPIPDEHKNPNRGTESPIRVADEVATGGESSAGVRTVAFNLPNDEKVREAKGSKKVLLNNVMRAKFEKILVPIALRTLAPEQVADVSLPAYLEEVLHHELSHGLGPGNITVDGRATEVRLELKDLYSTIEEAKADVMGVYNILALMDKGVIDPALRKNLDPTYVAGLFRSARFGIHEAHGQGVASQFNYLLEKGALVVDEEGRFRTVPEQFPTGIRDLLAELLMLQARGDYPGTAAFLEKYGHASPELLAALDHLEDLPVDIRPTHPDVTIHP